MQSQCAFIDMFREEKLKQNAKKYVQIFWIFPGLTKIIMPFHQFRIEGWKHLKYMKIAKSSPQSTKLLIVERLWSEIFILTNLSHWKACHCDGFLNLPFYFQNVTRSLAKSFCVQFLEWPLKLKHPSKWKTACKPNDQNPLREFITLFALHLHCSSLWI